MLFSNGFPPGERMTPSGEILLRYSSIFLILVGIKIGTNPNFSIKLINLTSRLSLISLCFPKYNIYSSAMVGGSIPIAVGTALSIKRNKMKNKVYCFMGEMTSETGIAHESIKFSRNYKLPIHFVIEDNEKSVCTDTREAWNQKKLTYEGFSDEYVTYYSYKLKYPHAGAGKRVQF